MGTGYYDTGISRSATVDLVEPRGPDHVVHLRLAAAGAPLLVAVVAGAAPPAAGAEIAVDLPVNRLHLFDADGRRLR